MCLKISNFADATNFQWYLMWEEILYLPVIKWDDTL